MFWGIFAGFIGGLGLFIYGLQLMSEGMQKAAGDKLRKILELLTSNPVIALFTGVVATVLVQSSTSTTVMLVGFVDAGMMTLTQAVGVIFGANIGTTVTAQVLSFDLAGLALPAVGIGFFMTFLCRRRRNKHLGQALLGFGLLFLGMQTMSSCLRPLREVDVFIEALAQMSRVPLLGVLAATLFTVLVQSSSATTGVVIALALQDMIGLTAGIALILGSNIGTCITACLASVGGNISAKRTALAHSLFNILGVLVFLVLMTPFARLVELTATSIARQVANAHTIFNVASALFFLPFINPFVALVRRLTPSRETVLLHGPQYLDERTLDTPAVALGNASKEVLRMLRIARSMVRDAMHSFKSGDRRLISEVLRKEDILNDLESEITVFLVRLSQRSLGEDQHRQLRDLMNMVSDIERIGDHAENIIELAVERLENGIEFSDQAVDETGRIFGETDSILSRVIKAIDTGDYVLALDAIKDDEIIDALEEEYRWNHIERLKGKRCDPEAGIVFTELLSNFERIADHATNLAEGFIGEKPPTKKHVERKPLRDHMTGTDDERTVTESSRSPT